MKTGEHSQSQGKIQIFPKGMKWIHQEQTPTKYSRYPPPLLYPNTSVKQKQ